MSDGAGRAESIGIMYGALHLDDLLQQVQAAGLRVREGVSGGRTEATAARGNAPDTDVGVSCEEGGGVGRAEEEEEEAQGGAVGWNVAWSMSNANLNARWLVSGTTGSNRLIFAAHALSCVMCDACRLAAAFVHSHVISGPQHTITSSSPQTSSLPPSHPRTSSPPSSCGNANLRSLRRGSCGAERPRLARRAGKCAQRRRLHPLRRQGDHLLAMAGHRHCYPRHI